MSQLETVLHKIVNRLPIFPAEKDELLTEVTAAFSIPELEDNSDANE